jgi:hypothetical protein
MAVQERGAWDVAWEAALDELELSLEESERLLRATPQDAAAGELVVRQDGTSVSVWTPPSLATPLPAQMLERAEGLLARQAELIGQTMAAMSRTRLDIEMVSRVSGAPRSGRSVGAVYLDVRA